VYLLRLGMRLHGLLMRRERQSGNGVRLLRRGRLLPDHDEDGEGREDLLLDRESGRRRPLTFGTAAPR
jgi:hypothetical protein